MILGFLLTAVVVSSSLLVREYRLHTPEEAGRQLDDFHEKRLAVGPDGWLYLYSRVGGQLVRIDPDSGEPAGFAHLQCSDLQVDLWLEAGALHRLRTEEGVPSRGVVLPRGPPGTTDRCAIIAACGRPRRLSVENGGCGGRAC